MVRRGASRAGDLRTRCKAQHGKNTCRSPRFYQVLSLDVLAAPVAGVTVALVGMVVITLHGLYVSVEENSGGKQQQHKQTPMALIYSSDEPGRRGGSSARSHGPHTQTERVAKLSTTATCFWARAQTYQKTSKKPAAETLVLIPQRSLDRPTFMGLRAHYIGTRFVLPCLRGIPGTSTILCSWRLETHTCEFGTYLDPGSFKGWVAQSQLYRRWNLRRHAPAHLKKLSSDCRGVARGHFGASCAPIKQNPPRSAT